MTNRVVTIGVYGLDAPGFLAQLRAADVRLLLDVRQRRGVRGPEYAWANARRLQALLAGAGIGYEHRCELAPTTLLRQLQYAEDARQGVGKRSRRELARRYTAEILNHADLAPIVASLPSSGAAALFCVERDPKACHRSLVAQRMGEPRRAPDPPVSPAMADELDTKLVRIGQHPFRARFRLGSRDRASQNGWLAIPVTAGSKSAKQDPVPLQEALVPHECPGRRRPQPPRVVALLRSP